MNTTGSSRKEPHWRPSCGWEADIKLELSFPMRASWYSSYILIDIITQLILNVAYSYVAPHYSFFSILLSLSVI